MDDKNQPNTSTAPATPETKSSGGINFDQLLITNQPPESVPNALHEGADTKTSITSPEAQPTDQITSLLTEANVAMKEHPE